MFIKIKAAYDLQRLSDLQNILLYLDDSNKEKLILISSDEKAERIKHLENQVISLKAKIDITYTKAPMAMAIIKAKFCEKLAEILTNANESSGTDSGILERLQLEHSDNVRGAHPAIY